MLLIVFIVFYITLLFAFLYEFNGSSEHTAIRNGMVLYLFCCVVMFWGKCVTKVIGSVCLKCRFVRIARFPHLDQI